MTVLAVDLGGSHASCALVSDDAILESESFPIAPGSALRDVLSVLEKPLVLLREKARLLELGCAGLGLSFCGIVDSANGRVLSTNGKYTDGPDLDLPAWARNSLGLAFLIENDARMALLGEWFRGSARGFDDVVMMTLGTGVGGAAMIKGRLLQGKHFQAGCLGGHFVVNHRGRACTCGNVGCVESEASTWALPQICRATPGFETSPLRHLETVGFDAVFEASASGDECALRVLDACLDTWAAGCITMIHAYDPEVVVIGGGLMRSADRILPRLQAHVARYAWTPWGKLNVRAAALGDSAALWGALPLFQMKTHSGSQN